MYESTFLFPKSWIFVLYFLRSFPIEVALLRRKSFENVLDFDLILWTTDLVSEQFNICIMYVFLPKFSCEGFALLTC